MPALRLVGPRPSANDHVTDKKYVDDQMLTRYLKPGGGIPKTDLDTSVQASLTKADQSAPAANPTFTGTVNGITKLMVGLGNVDNTSNATERSAVATLTGKTISGASNTLSNVSWSSLINIPASFTPAAHTHTTANITGLDTALSNKVDKGLTASDQIIVPVTNDPADNLTLGVYTTAFRNIVINMSGHLSMLRNDVDVKVPMSSEPNSVYIVNSEGLQRVLPYSTLNSPGTVAVRQAGGQLATATPVQATDAATKLYTDNKVQQVSALPGSPVAGVLYLIPKAV